MKYKAMLTRQFSCILNEYRHLMLEVHQNFGVTLYYSVRACSVIPIIHGLYGIGKKLEEF
jgi:hypothetical protein